MGRPPNCRYRITVESLSRQGEDYRPPLQGDEALGHKRSPPYIQDTENIKIYTTLKTEQWNCIQKYTHQIAMQQTIKNGDSPENEIFLSLRMHALNSVISNLSEYRDLPPYATLT